MAAFSAQVAAMHAAHGAKLEARTPGFRFVPPDPRETCDDARQRLSADLDRLYRIRTDARARAIRAGVPGITDATDWQPPHPLTPDAPDPIGDFLRAEMARDRPLSILALAAE